MKRVTSSSRGNLAAHAGPPSPDALAKRFFILAMLGVLACVGLIIALMSTST
jgi:hypothetical protein